MGAANKVNIVLFIESWNDFLTESEGNTTVIFSPTLNILIGIRPEEIAEKSSIGNISRSHNSLNLLKGAQFWAEATMHAENFLINNGSNGEAIKAVSESLPEFDIIATLALIVETIDSVDWRAFMISSKEEEIFGILNFVGKKKAHSFEWLFASINIVTQEEIVGIRGESSVLK